MTESTDLEAILSGSEARDVVEEVTTALDAAETTSTHVARDSSGEIQTATPAVPPPEAKPETPKPEPEHWTVKAVETERRKRQELERELEQLRANKQPEAKPNLFEDPENWEKALDERVTRKLAEVRQESEQRFLVLVEQAAKARHTDFEEVAQVFAETAKVTPGLVDEARQAPDPAEFIYQAGKNLKRVREAGSIEALIAQAEARGAEKARQELSGKAPPKIPESLTETAGTGERQPTFAPKPLNELLPSI